jgi:hypothetical protein
MAWLLKRRWFALAVLAIIALVVIGYELDKSMQYYYRNLPKATAHGIPETQATFAAIFSASCLGR